jgi:hypothetical protein
MMIFWTVSMNSEDCSSGILGLDYLDIGMEVDWLMGTQERSNSSNDQPANLQVTASVIAAMIWAIQHSGA